MFPPKALLAFIYDTVRGIAVMRVTVLERATVSWPLAPGRYLPRHSANRDAATSSPRLAAISAKAQPPALSLNCALDHSLSAISASAAPGAKLGCLGRIIEKLIRVTRAGRSDFPPAAAGFAAACRNPIATRDRAASLRGRRRGEASGLRAQARRASLALRRHRSPTGFGAAIAHAPAQL
jgi:hypothetical protein